MRAFQSLKDFDEDIYFQMLGCDTLDFLSQFPSSSDAESNVLPEKELFFPVESYDSLFKPPRIFDIILAERGEADFLDVQLRRQYLGGVADAHLIIESSFNCKNRTEKSLYFFDNKGRLDQFYGTYTRVRGGGAMSVELRGDGVVIENPEFDLRGALGRFYVASVMPPMESSDRNQAILCEHLIRNEGINSFLRHIAADSSDLLLILDVNEVPSRRALEILRSLYAFDPTSGRPKTLLPRMHRLHMERLRYSAADRCCLQPSESSERIGQSMAVSAGVVVRVDVTSGMEHNPAEKGTRNSFVLSRPYPSLQAVPAKSSIHAGGWKIEWIRDMQGSDTSQRCTRKRADEICEFVDDVERLHLSSEMSVVFVTGQIGSGPALLSPRPLVPHRAVVISNSLRYLNRASNIGYETKFITDIPAITYYSSYIGLNEYTNFSGLGLPEPVKADDVNIYNALQSKWLKIFPQYFLSPLFESHFEGRVYYLRMAVEHLLGNNGSLHSLNLDPRNRDLIYLAFALISNDASSLILSELHLAASYKTPDYIVWFDNKFALRTDNILDKLILFEASKTSMMMHDLEYYKGVWSEYKAALEQPRYLRLRSKMKAYIREEESRGFASKGVTHFQTGFIIYNMNHPNTSAIQQVWYQHVQRVGIQCQIAFYFVSQHFPNHIEIFEKDWGFPRTFLFMFSSVLR
jgi:hypothetical protein